MNYSVSYTSQRDGITIGVTADSFVEALSLLVDEFGEGVIPLYEHTRSEFAELCNSVDVITREEPSEVTEEAAVADEPGGAEVSSEELPEDEPGGPDAAPSASVADEAPGRQGDDSGDDVSPELRDAITSVVTADQELQADEGGEEDHRCTICGTEITADRAKGTVLMHGEARCPDCTP